MDKLSEYIPLLIIIASAIISIARKTKRPAKEIRLPEDIKEIFEPVESQPYFVPKTPVIKKKPEASIIHKTPTPAKKETIDNKVAETHSIDEYESNAIDFSEPEEMKKAIIYSEIFNRRDCF